ncbi:uncharacterized protein HD556DRAFT_658817 [Suillus plorans]|uniref:HNH nuclease domain-containing protein n=1 Tax=Suillus plorans TaxID=116603 RepID=A0A9P7AKD4_9AGAM|nr:uncharacterized protein HD556DRAFT_658817 [Suillus plorans]KAG1791216.1 hypothetical protein HD556DRAFT_658817 [Suillus plorans]
MSVYADSLASGWDPESSYLSSSAESVKDDRFTPSPDLQESSHDDYTPTRASTRESNIFATPTHRSDSGGLSSKTRTALDALYGRIYDGRRCLVTQSAIIPPTIAHAVQRASKPDRLTLYEFCLGLDFGSFHVDSRRNLFYLSRDWHYAFDANRWFLLPDADALVKVHGYVAEAITSRKRSEPSGIDHFRSKWNLKTKTRYTLVPLPSREHPLISRKTDDGSWNHHSYPYLNLPSLECHVAPPFAVINAGPKCTRAHIEQITLDHYPPQTSESVELTQRLTLLCDTWALFKAAKEAARAWELEKRGKRKRDQDDEDIERLSRGSKRAMRSQQHSTRGHTPKSDQPKDQPLLGSCKRKLSPGLSGVTLTSHAVLHLKKRQRTVDLKTRVRDWVEESTRASLDPDP